MQDCHLHSRSVSHSPTSPIPNGNLTANHNHGCDHSHSPSASALVHPHESNNYIDIGGDASDARGRTRHSRPPSLQVNVHPESPSAIDSPSLAVPSAVLDGVFSPLTPGYKFGKDDHYDAHHMSAHAPNLHAPDLHKPHAHEGHSHNMRGVFLHVMAVSLATY